MNKMIIDVREPDEFNSNHVLGAINIPVATLLNDSTILKDLDKNNKIILYCQSGNRAGIALNFLRANGFTNLENGINVANIKVIMQL
jgi:rhodanese-related sulfurtransferase